MLQLVWLDAYVILYMGEWERGRVEMDVTSTRKVDAVRYKEIAVGWWGIKKYRNVILLAK